MTSLIHACFRHLLCSAILMLAASVFAAPAGQQLYYVAPNGNDGWSGRLASPNETNTDGPFATLARARDAIRELRKTEGALEHPLTVQVRSGIYYLTEPLVFGPEDSGSDTCPITYAAYPGEKPIISGGCPVKGWRKGPGNLWIASVPEAKGTKPPGFQQFFVDGERQIRARHPNYEPANPYKGGFLFVRPLQGWAGDFGAGLASMRAGDWVEYRIRTAVEADYAVWVRYGAHNKPYGTEDIGGRTSLTVDGQAAVSLLHLPDTGSWGKFQWSVQPNATLHLTAGEHTLRWTNDKAPGINLDAIALSADPQWRPYEGKPIKTAASNPPILIQCEIFEKIQSSSAKADQYKGKDDIYFDPGTLHAWPASPDKMLHIWILKDCANALVPVAAIDESRSQLRTSRPIVSGSKVGAHFFVDNVREALDSPGEWYLDRASEELTYWPTRPDFAGTCTVVSALDRLIELRGNAAEGRPVAHLRFEGLTFEATDYALQENPWYHSESAAVWLCDASHCRFAGNRFVNLGGTAMVLYRACTDNEILGNEVAHGGSGGFTINSHPENLKVGGQPEPTPVLARRNRVSGNHVHDVGLIWKHAAGVYVLYSDDNIIMHNTIQRIPRQGIILLYNSAGNRIEYNEVFQSSQETADTGAIYLYAVHPSKPNIIRGNLVGDSGGLGTNSKGEFLDPHFSWGIYLDGRSSHTVVQSNVVYGAVRGAVIFNSGHDNLVENNIFVDARNSQFTYAYGSGDATGNRIERNVFCYRDPQAGQKTPPQGSGLVMDNNLWWCPAAPVSLQDMQRNGYEKHGLVADPLFVDPANNDYRLKPESPAFAVGFKPIDLTRVGVKGFSAAMQQRHSRKESP